MPKAIISKSGQYTRLHVVIYGVMMGVYRKKVEGIPPLPPLPPLPVPLEVGSLNPSRNLGSAASSASGVWGGPPAEI